MSRVGCDIISDKSYIISEKNGLFFLLLMMSLRQMVHWYPMFLESKGRKGTNCSFFASSCFIPAATVHFAALPSQVETAFSFGQPSHTDKHRSLENP